MGLTDARPPAYHATVPTGDVISQAAATGTTVIAGLAVSYVVSMGPSSTVPDAGRSAETQAAAVLTAVGLTECQTTGLPRHGPDGDVISQDRRHGHDRGRGARPSATS